LIKNPKGVVLSKELRLFNLKKMVFVLTGFRDSVGGRLRSLFIDISFPLEVCACGAHQSNGGYWEILVRLKDGREVGLSYFSGNF
jgi:hypothetical protein